MSIALFTRQVASIIIFVSALTCVPLMSSGASHKPPILGCELRNSQQQSLTRQLDNRLPKHLPISVRLKRDKEKAFSELENEQWLSEFELEVKNTGERPIYFFRLVLIPETGKPASERTLSFTLQYGRDDLVSLEAPVIPEDVAILPGEGVVLRIPAKELAGWDHLKKVQQWPAEWSKPKKATLMFETLNFGDGTGFDGGDGEPRQRKNP